MNNKLNILCIASWYPNRYNPKWGIFIKKHIEAISIIHNPYILAAIQDPNMKSKGFELTDSTIDGVRTVIVYYKQSIHIRKIHVIEKLVRYFIASVIGIRYVEKHLPKPDIVHLHVILPAGIIALYYKIFKNTNYIITEHWTGYTPENGDFERLPAKTLTRFIAKKSSFITTVSNFLKNAMTMHNIKGNYAIVPNIVENCEISDDYVRNSDTINILHVSFLKDRSKNVSGILRTAHKLYNLRTNFKINIVGDGSDRSTLENYAKELGIHNKCVFFHGMKSFGEICEFLKDTHFFVLFSNFETFSVVTAEALAAGIPVIATRSKGPEEFVEPDMGILIDTGNELQLFDAMVYMLDNYSKFDNTLIREKARNRFNKDRIAALFDKLYNDALGG
jgi:L-malate glycosyltransferase